MAEHRPSISTRPRPRPLKTIGMLNIVFGSVLLAISWLMIGGMGFNGMASGPNQALEEALQERAGREHEETLRRLSSLEDGAEHESTRALYRAERLRREERGPKSAPDTQMMMVGGQMQGFATWSVVDATTALVANLLMIASGIGLVQRVEWGRRLGVWVAGIKVARLAVLYTFFVVVIVPPMARTLGETVGESMAGQGGGMPAGMPNLTQIYAVIYSAWGVFMIVAGSIYPIITLVLLTRPGIRAASLPAETRGRMMLEAARS